MDHLFLYHPGCISPPGALQHDGGYGFAKESMGFVPSSSVEILHKVEVFINQKSHIYVKIIASSSRIRLGSSLSWLLYAIQV